VRCGESWKAEVQDSVLNQKFPDSGAKGATCHFPSIELIMWLAGKHAKKFCSLATEILTHYYDGDVSPQKEIEAKAASDAPSWRGLRLLLTRVSSMLVSV